MNNFTLCHGAILAGLEGPNAAFYSRGAGTVTALREAAFAVAGGETARALAGGADSALHLVTASELAREGWTAAGLAPAEGGALLALAEAAPGAECPRLLRAEVLRAPGRPLGELAARALAAEPPTHPVVFVLGGWGPAAASALRQSLAHYPGASIDATALFGEALAAAPALAWVLALDWLANRAQGRAVVLTAGIDGALGVVSFAKEIP
jgi:uncharacterized protein YgbK (DUF1537 family)